LRGKNTCGLHSAASFWTEEALDLQTSLQRKAAAIVADPVVVRNFVDAVTFLVHGNIAISAEHNQVFILIIAIIADGALSVFLNDEASLVGRQLLVANILCEVGLLGFTLCELLEDDFVIDVVFFLLPHFDVAEEFLFGTTWVVNV
jgi:hypothetical protein